MVDHMKECSGLVLLNRASALFPNNPHAATCWRWAQVGVRGVRLRTTVVGGRRYTSQSDVDEFLAALNQPRDAAAVDSKASLRAADKLASMGF